MLNTELSPLYKIRLQYSNNNQLKNGILLLLRFLIRVPVSDNTRNQLNHQFIEKLHNYQNLFKQQENVTTTKRKDILQRTVSLIERNEGSIAFSLPNEKLKKRIEDEQIQDTLFYNYLLLDTAAVWPMLRFENSLISLEVLCIAWHHKCNDIFDSCFQLLKNYWAR